MPCRSARFGPVIISRYVGAGVFRAEEELVEDDDEEKYRVMEKVM